jgi:multidrug transporter EmrE-like cation transporter
MQIALATFAAMAFTTGGILMKAADGVRRPLPTLGFIALFVIGASLQSLAMRSAELGATYILVLGLEAALAVGLGVLLFDERVTATKLAAVALIVAGIAMLRAS